MSRTNEKVYIRAGTFEVKAPKGKYGSVLKLKPEAVEQLISELSAKGISEQGATLFINTFENESTHSDAKPGDTYLSSSINVVVTDSDKPDVRKASIGNRINNAYNKSGKFQARK